MRTSKYIILGCLLLVGATSCKKWLDVNTDPSSPNNESAALQNRLPWIEHFYQYTSGVSNYRAAAQAGVYYSTNGTSGNQLSTTWTVNTGNTTPYQTWFVEVASNLNDLYDAAKKQNAYHYMAAADVFHALGFMEMLDLYGEMPYTQALTKNPSPGFDDGKAIYNGCMAKLNEAISLFNKPQDATVTALATGDLWSAGNVDKWIKLCWGLKARYMLKLSKKADLYNPDSILYCLSKGPQSNADNTVGPGFNNSTVVDYLISDPVVTNGNFDYAAFGSTQRLTQYYVDKLTNMRGSGVVDPRMTKIVPASMANVKLDGSGRISSYTWLRGIGVDVHGTATRLVKGGSASITSVTYSTKNDSIRYKITNATDRQNFINDQMAYGRTFRVRNDTVVVIYPTGTYYINSPNYLLAGDTVYVNLRSSAIATSGITAQGPLDVSWYQQTAAFNAGVVASTGSFQVRPVSDQEILTYHEMCFIKAEVYLRKNDGANAKTAYLAGIQAHMDMMQAKLTSWQAAGYTATNPDMAPMKASDISAYMTSAAVAQGNPTMSDVMLQKYLAMGCSIENWNDMRRFNYSVGNVGSFGVVYPAFQRSPLFSGTALYTGSGASDPRYWPRRWSLPNTLELNYNITNALALNPHATDPNIWSMPVWWDCATDAEYNGYLSK
ncbi:SusD/RagB family nutrient-binding outer membrane lipoprotein [Pinibacter soli]|uniref:SusD/RagB family nutrient-binding outer membrane lipoprotein n=1 Tax=Pinibacter soli TaxID=3044211 RepID=A0ABT6RFW8_9BACT|nr:SusD/RagB family nutrient-binding outer membrane lipoprotein [Pinibacter soli]MDI3321270.1 SusD/RagB family nutrient-binding outer membrane lipoprotein [Pinibacter soli]